MNIHPSGILIQNVFLEQDEIMGRFWLRVRVSFAILPGVGGRIRRRSPLTEILP
jgi:hypothetical protein